MFRRVMNTLLAVAALAVVLLLALLAWATGSTGRLERWYTPLLVLNGVVAFVLFAWVVGLVWQMLRAVLRRQFGARLTARFALSFALVGILPGLLLYLLSVQFLSRSMEAWFNVRVDTALESGLTLGRAALDAQMLELVVRARTIATGLGNSGPAVLGLELTRLRDQAGVEEALLFTGSGRVLSLSGQRLTALLPDLPNPTQMRQLRAQGSLTTTEVRPSDGREQYRIIVPVLVPLPIEMSGGQELVYLQLIQPVPEQIASNARAVREGFDDYQELASSREGLRQLYGITLTIALLLAVFASIASAFYLSRRLTRPLLKLAQATQKVGEGDFSPLPERLGTDELAQLTRSFNLMTRQLSETRVQLDTNRMALLQANTYLETILGNLSSGVVVLNRDFEVTRFNQGALAILQRQAQHLLDPDGDAALHALLTQVRAAFAEHLATESTRAYWQRQIEWNPHSESNEPSKQSRSTLLARGSLLPGEDHLLVFDDITEVISANRAFAWAEVARRLAHEIKNPLTPIGLSAERLDVKLGPRLAEADRGFLARHTGNILQQVEAMRRMVNEFRDYSRLPPAHLQAMDLNACVLALLGTYGLEDGRLRMPGGTLHADLQLDPDLPRLMADTEQLAQVIHNLVQNSQDAMRESGVEQPTLRIRTELRTVSSGREPARAAVVLTLEDNGPGFPPAVLHRAFEPYVTTKPQGTGLGLAIVRKILDDHGARIELANNGSGGAKVSILFTQLAGEQRSP